jgi:hypothetical protein
MIHRPQTSGWAEHKGAVVLGVLVLASLAFGAWGAWQVFAPVAGDPRAQGRQIDELGEELDQLRQRVATLTRSDQISRDANRDLQGAIADRDEEIAGLRADVAFYERLVGATAQRRGLSVHALRLQPQDGPAWHFATTLTQNLNRGAVSDGTLTVAVEGTREGRLQKLGWSELRQQANAPAVPYSFKYFQQVDGDIFLPAGLTPVKVTVRLQPRSGAPIEQSFTWAEATRAPVAAPAP